MRNRLLRQLRSSQLDFAVVLAQDAVYRADGSRDDDATHFYVANDYVLALAAECEKVVPGCSINPIRKDALRELERCRAAGARLIKVHTAIQGVDPSRPEFEPFYRLAAELDVVLMFHTGYEHSCTVVSQQYTDPRKLARALDTGRPVIAAHCGTCAFFDREDYFPRFVEMMGRYDNLFGDTAIMASLIRARSLKRLSLQEESLRADTSRQRLSLPSFPLAVPSADRLVSSRTQESPRSRSANQAQLPAGHRLREPGRRAAWHPGATAGESGRMSEASWSRVERPFPILR